VLVRTRSDGCPAARPAELPALLALGKAGRPAAAAEPSSGTSAARAAGAATTTVSRFGRPAGSPRHSVGRRGTTTNPVHQRPAGWSARGRQRCPTDGRSHRRRAAGSAAACGRCCSRVPRLLIRRPDAWKCRRIPPWTHSAQSVRIEREPRVLELRLRRFGRRGSLSASERGVQAVLPAPTLPAPGRRIRCTKGAAAPSACDDAWSALPAPRSAQVHSTTRRPRYQPLQQSEVPRAIAATPYGGRTLPGLRPCRGGVHVPGRRTAARRPKE
jgi:hypothetical protein